MTCILQFDFLLVKIYVIAFDVQNRNIMMVKLSN